MTLLRKALVALAIVITASGGYIALWIFGYLEMPLPAKIVVNSLIQNQKRPAIIDWDITAENWTDRAGARTKINGILQQRFPPGTPETTLITNLREQGFRFPRPIADDCRSATSFNGAHRWTCAFPAEVPAKELEYEWGNFVCGETVSVTWSLSARGDVISLEGNYRNLCL